MSQQQAERIADTVLEAIESEDSIVVRLNEEIEIELDVLKGMVGDDALVSNTAVALIGMRVAEKMIEVMTAARNIARKRIAGAKAPPLKPFYALDEYVPGGRHEVRLLRYRGKAVGRYVVPMDGEWSPQLTAVNKAHELAVAAYEAQSKGAANAA